MPNESQAIHDVTGVDVVDPEQIEQTIEAKQIGERIRRLRVRRSMGLVELGTKTGLSASFLSQLETGRVVPTVRNLARIALAFGKDLAYFFRDEQPITFRMMRRNERVRIQSSPDAGASFVSESMSSLIADHAMIPCIAEFTLSDAESHFRPRIFEGIEFTFVMEGCLTLTSEQETRVLEAGDVAWLDGTRKRVYHCPPGVHSRAVIITKHNKQ